MAFQVSPTFQSLSEQINKEPMLVLEIEGSQYLYGSAPIFEVARWDDERITWDNEIGVTWDGQIEKANSKPYIIMKGKTTKTLSQQLLVDKGGSGSVATMDIELVDYRGEVAQDLSFDQIGDPLGKKATVYMGFKGGVFPNDFIAIMRGYVDDLRYNAGSITVSTALATNLIRQSSYEQYQSQLTIAINSTTTTIPVVTTQPFLETQDALTSYIRIGDEIMEVTGVDTGLNQFTVIRERLGTIADSHDFESDVTSYYKLAGNPIDLALKLLHSKQNNEFQDVGLEVTALNRISSTELVQNAIIVNDLDVEAKLGLVEGDLINLVGTTSNDGVKTVSSFGTTLTGTSFIVVEETLTEENGLNLPLNIKSKYNVLPDGAGLDIEFVDTVAFEEVRTLYTAAFIDYDFSIKDTIDDTREYIIKEIMTPQALYLIPRQAKTSCRFTAPPFSAEEIPVLNTLNLYDLTKLEMRRSTHKYLINNVVYRYNEGILEDKFFDKVITSNADSFNRIPIGRQRREVEASGIRRSAESLQTVERLSSRILNRYKFASRYIRNVKVLLSVGLRVEIGDVVFFGGEDTQLVNLETGERNLPASQYEVINKKLDASRGQVTLELLETGFGIDGIFGTFSPSSIIAAGSATDRLLLSRLWDTSQFDTEREKWTRWEGLKVRVRSEDYCFDEVTTFTFDPANNSGLLLDPPLSFTPLEGYVVELAKLEEYGEDELEEIVKLTHTFTMPNAELTAVTSAQVFEVSSADAALLAQGMQINVHSEDYIRDSDTRIIDDITGTTITLDEDLDITPQVGDILEVYAFAEDKGYRLL